MPSYDRSAALHERACRVLAGGVSSEFRRFSQPHPLFYTRGRGTRITDADGNEYLDFTLSQGPLILGHSHPEVLARVADSCATGQLFAGQYEQELELAERLQRLIPCAERLRFALSGSEADHAAFRAARCLTGRGKILRFEGHYHGWLDNVAQGIGGPSLEALGPREHPNLLPWSKGLPERVRDEFLVLPWNDLALAEKTIAEHAGELAAVVTEPVMCNNGCILPRPGFLEGLRAACDRHGVLLIFDEVITGFRLALGGAQQYFGVIPDLAVFGKALANGYPISVLCGREKVMDVVARGEAIHAGTMNSGQSGVAAALAVLDVLEREPVHERLFALGRKLMAGLREAAQDAGQEVLVQGPGPMLHLGFTSVKEVHELRDCFAYDKARYAAFVRGMQDRGVRLIGRGLWYVSAAHSEADVDACVATTARVFRELN
ncbi:MAG: aspartate aminotransferase family protein [Planctomycetes bacterium]|nr:aspartate aminotransferase family protein [Planctomycetota bacterium]